jgi:uncharacterized membrane protein YbhN (UPF0104 family)
MNTDLQQPPRPTRPDRKKHRHGRVRKFFAGYFWFIFKNVIGWVLILSSIPVGFTFPGPGGLPLFLVGFALVTFPGKRQLTSRVMRGRGLPLEAQIFTFLTAFFAIVATCIAMWFIADRVDDLLQRVNLDPRQKEATYTAVLAGLLVTGLFALGMTWIVMRLSLHVLNYILRGMPIIRRKIRPWLRKHGFILLPSRHKIGEENSQANMSDQIIEIQERQQDQLRSAGASLLRWAKRAIGVSITVAIFIWILKPIVKQWPLVHKRVLETNIPRFALAAGMFALFLFAFRSLVWRRILTGFGHKLPVAAATRIWSTSELARYLPGFIWQVVGRVYLVRPYGVSGSVCSITQVLELALFLLANILVAVSCLLYFGIKNLEGAPRGWLFFASALAPVLLLLLHPKIFYGIINRVMERLRKPAIVHRLGARMLLAMLLWNIIGLLWQSLAIFVIVQKPLGLKEDWWWVVAGAYCLAWCAGFLAFWAPGGIGVREIIFIGAMRVILPPQVRNLEGDAFLPMLAFLSVLLRLWATSGELLLAAAAYAIDFRGAIGRPDAPGRIPIVPRDINNAAV